MLEKFSILMLVVCTIVFFIPFLMLVGVIRDAIQPGGRLYLIITAIVAFVGLAAALFQVFGGP